MSDEQLKENEEGSNKKSLSGSGRLIVDSKGTEAVIRPPQSEQTPSEMELIKFSGWLNKIREQILQIVSNNPGSIIDVTQFKNLDDKPFTDLSQLVSFIKSRISTYNFEVIDALINTYPLTENRRKASELKAKYLNFDEFVQLLENLDAQQQERVYSQWEQNFSVKYPDFRELRELAEAPDLSSPPGIDPKPLLDEIKEILVRCNAQAAGLSLSDRQKKYLDDYFFVPASNRIHHLELKILEHQEEADFDQFKGRLSTLINAIKQIPMTLDEVGQPSANRVPYKERRKKLQLLQIDLLRAKRDAEVDKVLTKRTDRTLSLFTLERINALIEDTIRTYAEAAERVQELKRESEAPPLDKMTVEEICTELIEKKWDYSLYSEIKHEPESRMKDVLLKFDQLQSEIPDDGSADWEKRELDRVVNVMRVRLHYFDAKAVQETGKACVPHSILWHLNGDPNRGLLNIYQFARKDLLIATTMHPEWGKNISNIVNWIIETASIEDDEILVSKLRYLDGYFTQEMIENRQKFKVKRKGVEIEILYKDLIIGDEIITQEKGKKKFERVERIENNRCVIWDGKRNLSLLEDFFTKDMLEDEKKVKVKRKGVEIEILYKDLIIGDEIITQEKGKTIFVRVNRMHYKNLNYNSLVTEGSRDYLDRLVDEVFPDEQTLVKWFAKKVFLSFDMVNTVLTNRQLRTRTRSHNVNEAGGRDYNLMANFLSSAVHRSERYALNEMDEFLLFLIFITPESLEGNIGKPLPKGDKDIAITKLESFFGRSLTADEKADLSGTVRKARSSRTNMFDRLKGRHNFHFKGKYAQNSFLLDCRTRVITWQNVFFDLDGIEGTIDAPDFNETFFPDTRAMIELHPSETLKVGRQLITGDGRKGKEEKFTESNLYLAAENGWEKMIKMMLDNLGSLTFEDIVEKHQKGGKGGLLHQFIGSSGVGGAKMFPGDHLNKCLGPFLLYYIKRLFSCYDGVTPQSRIRLFDAIIEGLEESVKDESGLKGFDHIVHKQVIPYLKGNLYGKMSPDLIYWTSGGRMSELRDWMQLWYEREYQKDAPLDLYGEGPHFEDPHVKEYLEVLKGDSDEVPPGVNRLGDVTQQKEKAE